MKELLPVGPHRPGDIAPKGLTFRPLRQTGLDLRLMTRIRAKLDRLGDAYRISHRYTDWKSSSPAAFGPVRARVHRSARAHRWERLLQAGCMSTSTAARIALGGARQVVELAEAATLALWWLQPPLRSFICNLQTNAHAT